LTLEDILQSPKKKKKEEPKETPRKKDKENQKEMKDMEKEKSKGKPKKEIEKEYEVEEEEEEEEEEEGDVEEEEEGDVEEEEVPIYSPKKTASDIWEEGSYADKRSKQSKSPHRRSSNERKKVVRWNADEEKALISGVAAHGRNWSEIKRTKIFDERTSVDLKDKFRNMMKYHKQTTEERIQLELDKINGWVKSNNSHSKRKSVEKVDKEEESSNEEEEEKPSKKSPKSPSKTSPKKRKLYTE